MSEAVELILKRYSYVNDQLSKDELKIILNTLSDLIEQGKEGAVVEFGCYAGATSIFISRLLQMIDPKRPFHVYDSFEGLPEKTVHDNSPAGQQFVAGELRFSKKVFVEAYKKAGVHLPYIHKGWFRDLRALDLPDKIALAFLDGDYYQSIYDCLELIRGNLSPGSVVIVDDYHNEALPGVQKAVDECAGGRNISVSNSLAILRL